MPSAIDCAPTAATHAPDSAPVKMRAIIPGVFKRLGVDGRLSFTSSSSASKLKIIAAGSLPINESGVPRKNPCQNPAHAMTASGVSARSPAITPIRNARSSTSVELMATSFNQPPETSVQPEPNEERGADGHRCNRIPNSVPAIRCDGRQRSGAQDRDQDRNRFPWISFEPGLRTQHPEPEIKPEIKRRQGAQSTHDLL